MIHMRFKKKKAKKQRASTYHGWGRGKSHHKGAGNRGGRGNAGSGKRSDGKKPSFWNQDYYGRRGFTSKNRKQTCAINIKDIYSNLNEWVQKGFAVKMSAGYNLDLGKAGYTKLLGTGPVKEKLFIKTDFASRNAIEQIKKSGGEVQVLKVIVKKEKKKSAKHKKAEAKEQEEKTGSKAEAQKEASDED
jgi:large subunit ribosomal protein L15